MFEYSIDQVALLTVQLAGPVGYTKTRKSLFVSKDISQLVRQNHVKRVFSPQEVLPSSWERYHWRVGGGIRWWDYDDEMSPQTRPQSAHKNKTHITESTINPSQVKKNEPRIVTFMIKQNESPPSSNNSTSSIRHPPTSPQSHWQQVHYVQIR